MKEELREFFGQYTREELKAGLSELANNLNISSATYSLLSQLISIYGKEDEQTRAPTAQ